MKNYNDKTPIWFIAILAVCMIVAIGFIPFALSHLSADEAYTQTWYLSLLFPIYCGVTGYLAYKSYPQRSYLSWVLIFVMLLSFIAEFLLLNQ